MNSYLVHVAIEFYSVGACMYIAAIAFCIFEDSFEIKCIIIFECFTFLYLKTLGREGKRYRKLSSEKRVAKYKTRES